MGSVGKDKPKPPPTSSTNNENGIKKHNINV
jgi:hypothetical protein